MRPRSSDPRFASDADRAACRKAIREGSRSFAAASLLLPYRIREAAYALYAFCRLSDDLVDIEGGSTDAIARLRERLGLAYRGEPADIGIDRAFADVVIRFGVPRALPEALIDGLAWDVAGVSCEELSDLHAYAACVAGSVGAMMSVLMGEGTPEIVARACDLGVAMQLTNIARDVGEDARNGRLYLPRSWLRAEGLDPDAWLAHPVFNPMIGAAVARLLQAADDLYRRADGGIAGLPAGCRAGIFAARHIYREIGVPIARRGFDSVSVRARVTRAHKLRLVGRSLLDAARAGSSRVGPSPVAAPPLPETAYLVDAVAASQPTITRPVEPGLGIVPDRIMWVAELFAALEARERLPGERA